MPALDRLRAGAPPSPHRQAVQAFAPGQVLGVGGVTAALVAALVVIDVAGAIVAVRHNIAGEPFGIGGRLGARRPLVLALWGTGLSAPLAPLALAVVFAWWSPTLLRVLAALFVVGGMSEPVFWGRRACPWYGRALLVGHVATSLAIVAATL